MSKAIALYDFKASSEEENELSVKKNELLLVVEKHESWWKVENAQGKSGLVPVDYLAAPVTEDMKVLLRGKTKQAHQAKSGDEISVENDCQIAILDKTDEYWWFVGISGKTGYIPKHIIKLFKKSSTVEQGSVGSSRYNLKDIAPARALCDENATILFSFQKALPTEGEFITVFKGDHCEKAVDVERLNDYTLKAVTPQFYPPEHTKITINHQKTGQGFKPVAKGVDFLFESRLDSVHKILMKETDPMNFLCSSFQIEHGDMHNVDHILSGTIEKKIPDKIEVFKSKPSVLVHDEVHPKETPTLLHFAAFYNLKKLTRSLLKCPGAQEALLVRNCNGMAPASLAEWRKHDELKTILQDHKAAEGREEYEEDVYTSMENCYEQYISMDGKNGGYLEPKGLKPKPKAFDDEELYEDMDTPQEPDEHYDTPRAQSEDRFEMYDRVDNKQDRDALRQQAETQKKIEEYKVFGRMTEKEVQLALIMKRVKERYITQEQALEMAKVLRLEPQANGPPTTQKPKVVKRVSAPQVRGYKKADSLSRTYSTSSSSSMSSVSSSGSVGSSGDTVVGDDFGRLKPTNNTLSPGKPRVPLPSPPVSPKKPGSRPPAPVPRNPMEHVSPAPVPRRPRHQ